jgi:hypothetical protein
MAQHLSCLVADGVLVCHWYSYMTSNTQLIEQLLWLAAQHILPFLYLSLDKVRAATANQKCAGRDLPAAAVTAKLTPSSY